jgi:NADH:ubiquinone oxidoreductase subunit 3 (subunit A)
MTDLREIPGIGSTSLELLEVAGIRDAELLARQDADFLLSEIIKANESLEIVSMPPDKSMVEEWIAGAVDLVGETPEESFPDRKTSEKDPVNYEEYDEVTELLTSSPFAIPLPEKMMMERQLKISDVPEGFLLSRYSGSLDFRVEDARPERPKANVPSRRDASPTERVLTREHPRNFDASQLKAIIPEPGAKRARTIKSKDTDAHDRVGLIRTPREKTNRGKNPASRRYIRGVLHTHPWRLRLAAVFTLLIMLTIPLAIASAILLLLSGEQTQNFGWVPEWVLAFPIAVPVIGFLYLILSMSAKCRICTQKLFVRSVARKHARAHRIPGLGHIVPLALHLLLFSWFRCSACGTPVRLKK